MKSNASGAFGTAQRRGEVAVAQLLHSTQQQYFAVRHRKGSERTFELLVVFVGYQIVEWGGVAVR